MHPDVERATLGDRTRGGIVARGRKLLEQRIQQYDDDREALPSIENPNQRLFHALRLEREQTALAESAAVLERLTAAGVDGDESAVELR